MGHMLECSASVFYLPSLALPSAAPIPAAESLILGQEHPVDPGGSPLSNLKTLKLTLVFGACSLTEMTVCHKLC